MTIKSVTVASLLFIWANIANAELVLTEHQMDQVTAGAVKTAFAQNAFFQAFAFAEGMTVRVFADVGTNFAQARSFAAGSTSASSSSTSRSFKP